eukprot:m.405162 g.405162  ORF g.405162 m.405162 type:complete len:173 (+) comp28426_c0_seq2:401-919(+)
MTLFEHSNLVAAIGVVTAPRDMPVMLCLEYCERGTLLDHVKGSTTDTLTTARLLTYCHDTASGLHYLASRRIVHRDIAARNVLLDSAYTCKVSDFGMSAALAGGADDSDYAANYVKLGGEVRTTTSWNPHAVVSSPCLSDSIPPRGADVKKMIELSIAASIATKVQLYTALN